MSYQLVDRKPQLSEECWYWGLQERSLSSRITSQGFHVLYNTMTHLADLKTWDGILVFEENSRG